MAEKSQQSIVVDAALEDVMAVIADFESYPEWAQSIKATEVVEEHGDGRPSKVRFVMDAGAVKDDYTLRYDWAEDGSSVSWSLVDSRVMKSQEGSYVLEEIDGRTRVTYALSIETNMPMLGLLRRKGEKIIMDVALRELKKRVEA